MVAASLVLGLSQPVGAATDTALAGDEIRQLQSFFDKYGVDEATQARLFAKLEEGRLWDSLRPSASPVSEETTLDGGYQVTTSTYADGSIVVAGAPSPAAGGRRTVSSVNQLLLGA